VLAPQQGRRLTPSIIQSIVDAVKNDYSRNNYNYETHAWTNLSASRRTIPDFVNQFAPLITAPAPAPAVDYTINRPY
jgi:hypothetical protein